MNSRVLFCLLPGTFYQIMVILKSLDDLNFSRFGQMKMKSQSWCNYATFTISIQGRYRKGPRDTCRTVGYAQ